MHASPQNDWVVSEGSELSSSVARQLCSSESRFSLAYFASQAPVKMTKS